MASTRSGGADANAFPGEAAADMTARMTQEEEEEVEDEEEEVEEEEEEAEMELWQHKSSSNC